jgi:hypothetical protein
VAVPKKALDRIVVGLKRYTTVLRDAKTRDISESDTVVIVGDMLRDVLGYDKYTEVTTEFAIRGSYVDLAVKVGNDVRFLIEVKAIGVALKDSHVKQAVDYGANQGIEWILLTNGWNWQIYKIEFGQPIDKAKVFDIDLFQLTGRSDQVVDCFGNLSREGFTASSMAAVFQQQRATSKFSLAAILQSDNVITAARRELRRLFPGLKIDDDQVRTTIIDRVLKRELVESDEAKQAAAMIKKAAKAADRAKAKEAVEKDDQVSPAPAEPATAAATAIQA